MFRQFTICKGFFVPCLLLGIAGCGGGGGGGPVTTSLSVSSPSAVASASLTQGSAFAGSTGDYGKATSISLDSSGAVGYYAIESFSDTSGVQLHPKGHVTDTAATTAWAQGWTGHGKTIAILDDFSDVEAVYVPITVTRTATQTGRDASFGSVTMTGTYDVDYHVKFNTTHGDIIANIAGGDAAATSTNTSYNFDASSVTETNCNKNGATAFYSCQADDSWYQRYWDDNSGNVTFNKVAGVAKDATIIQSHIDLGSGNTTSLTSAAAKFNNLGSSADVINLSLSSPWTSGVKWSDIESAWQGSNYGGYFNATSSTIVIAAGNSSASCASTDMANCNAVATILALDTDTSDETIVVGALNSSGTGIATYSNQAGVLKNKYLMASGETGYYFQANNTPVVGTSVSAPRVAGAAAILRQKFPNLTGGQTASVLLLTADKDIDNNGIDDFSGVSDVFGHGKLDLSTALSPVGSLAVR